MAIAAASAKVHPSQGPAPPPPPARRTVACTHLTRIAAHAVIGLLLASLWLFYLGLAAFDIGQFVFGRGCAAALIAVYKVVCVAGVTLVLVLPSALLLERMMVRARRAASTVPVVAAATVTDMEAAKEPALRTRTSDAAMRLRGALLDPITLAGLAAVAFALLKVIAFLVVGDSTVRGSRRQRMAAVIYYVGALGMHTVGCFVFCPLITLRVWRSWRKARRAL